jgi:hypothetical protein
VDCTRSGGGEWTTSADGFNVIVVGNRETNANLHAMQDHDGACNNGEVDHTGSGDGEWTNGAGGMNVVVVGDGERNGSLGDSERELTGTNSQQGYK